MKTTDSGLTMEDAQAAICKGTYGGKVWSASEKQAACDRYEQLTGTKLEADTTPVGQLVFPIVGIAIIIGAGVIFYYLHKRNNNKKRRIN